MVYYHGREVIAYYIAEPSEGQDPANNPNTHKVLGQLVDKEYIYDPEPVVSNLSGGVDPADQKYGIATPQMNINLEVDDADGKAFLATYQNTDNTFQLVLATSGGIIIARMVGCKIKSAAFAARNFSGSSTNYGPSTLGLTLWGIDIKYTALANAAYNSPSATFISFSDVIVQRAGGAIADWWEAGFTMDWELVAMPTKDTGTGRWQVATIKRGDRKVTPYYVQASQGAESADYDAARAGTKINVAILIGAQTWTFGNCLMKVFNVRSPNNGMHGKRFEWSPTTITVA